MFQGHAVAREPLKAGRRRKRTGYARDAAVPVGEQVVDGPHHTREVVSHDSVRLVARQPSVGEDNVDTGIKQSLQVCGRPRRRQDHAGDVLVNGKTEVLGLLRRVFVSVAKEHRVARLMCAVFDPPGDIGKERARAYI